MIVTDCKIKFYHYEKIIFYVRYDVRILCDRCLCTNIF